MKILLSVTFSIGRDVDYKNPETHLVTEVLHVFLWQ